MSEPSATPIPEPGNGLEPLEIALPPPRYRRGTPVELADGQMWSLAPLTLDLIDEGGPATELFARAAGVMLNLTDPNKAGLLPVAVGTLSATVISLVHLSLTRNYPQLELTRQDVGRLLDLACLPAVIEALFALNGMRARFSELLGNLGLSPPPPGS